MALKIIVSYDDTDNDRDALALGRLLAFSGAELSLAYVRHSFGEALEQKEAEELLARGAASVGAPDMPRHVVVNAGTSVGLTELAERENADVIVFGSEYRTAPGTVKPGISAHKLLLGGPAAIAVAPAGLRSNPSVSVNTVGVIDEGDAGARQTADSLAARARRRASPSTAPARSTCSSSAPAPRPREGKVVLSASSDYAVEAATYPVLVMPRGVALDFGDRELRPPGRLTTRITAATSGSRPSIRLPRLAPANRPAVVAGDEVGGHRLRRVGFDHDRRRAALGGGTRAARAAVAGDVLRGPLGVRPALAEGEVRSSPSAGPRGSSGVLSRGFPLAVAELDRPVRRARARAPSSRSILLG